LFSKYRGTQGKAWGREAGDIPLLGFHAHLWEESHEGYPRVLRKMIGKRMAAKLRQIHQQPREGLHEQTKGTTEWLQSQRGATQGVPARSAAHVVVAASAAESKNPLDGNQFWEKLGQGYWQSRLCIRILTVGPVRGERATGIPTATAGPTRPATRQNRDC